MPLSRRSRRDPVPSPVYADAALLDDPELPDDGLYAQQRQQLANGCLRDSVRLIGQSQHHDPEIPCRRVTQDVGEIQVQRTSARCSRRQTSITRSSGCPLNNCSITEWASCPTATNNADSVGERFSTSLNFTPH